MVNVYVGGVSSVLVSCWTSPFGTESTCANHQLSVAVRSDSTHLNSLNCCYLCSSRRHLVRTRSRESFPTRLNLRIDLASLRRALLLDRLDCLDRPRRLIPLCLVQLLRDPLGPLRSFFVLSNFGPSSNGDDADVPVELLHRVEEHRRASLGSLALVLARAGRARRERKEDAGRALRMEHVPVRHCSSCARRGRVDSG